MHTFKEMEELGRHTLLHPGKGAVGTAHTWKLGGHNGVSVPGSPARAEGNRRREVWPWKPCGCNHEGWSELPPCLAGNGSGGWGVASPHTQHQPLAHPWEKHSLECSLQVWNPRLAQPPVRNLSSEPGAAGLSGIFRKVRLLRLLPVPYKV